MSTITTSPSPSTSAATRLLGRRAKVALVAVVLFAAAIALSVWLLVQSPVHQQAKVTGPDLTSVQKLGVKGQGGNPAQAGDLCPPAPGQRLC